MKHFYCRKEELRKTALINEFCKGKPAIYNAIIKAVAEGASRLNDITTKVGEYNSVVSKYLKTLIDLGIVKKETPITEKPGRRT